MRTNWMLEHFTEDEIERMSAFTKTPPYEREPEQLLPNNADEESEFAQEGSSRSR